MPPSLLDIAPPEIAIERIDIRGVELEVRGVRNREWVSLLRRFPVLRKEVAKGRPALNGEDAEPVDPAGFDDEFAVASLDVIPAVIAAGLGQVGNAEIERAVAERLTDAEQQQVFGVIMRLTNPPSPLAGGPAPAGQAQVGRAGAADETETGSPRPSSS